MNYARAISTRSTPQSEAIPGKNQTANNAGGFGFAVDDWTRLDRFLILGSESSTYYVSERKLAQDNAQAVLRCLRADGARAVLRIREISESGRAPKNDPAIFALALAMKYGDHQTRHVAYDALSHVCRIGTHLFTLLECLKELDHGWGRGLTRAVSNWYNDKPVSALAYQLLKYQERNHWRHHDVLHLCHAKPPDEGHNTLYAWAKSGWPSVGAEPHDNPDLHQLWAAERAKHADTKTLCNLITDYKLPREAIPTEKLRDPSVWEALLQDMPMTAMIRNLATMSKIGLLTPFSVAERLVSERLANTERLKHARLHPIALLSAETVYAQGHGERSDATWTASPKIVDALDQAFYNAFQCVEPTSKRHLLALDVSGSMASGTIAGIPGLTPRVVSAALAMVTLAVESRCMTLAFSASASVIPYTFFSARNFVLTPLPLSPRQRLDDVVAAVSDLPFGGTDCALPMLWAKEHKIDIDAFVILTDSETWAGTPHPCQALNDYRQAAGIPATLIVVGMTATEISIADPDDAGMLDVVGADTATPQLIADFVRDHANSTPDRA